MKKFVYEHDASQIHLEAADMDIDDLAVEIGSIVNHLYTSLARQEPMAALQFKSAVLITMMPGSPVWTITEQTEGSSTMIMLGKK